MTAFNPDNYDPDFWQEGQCANANIVTYDGDDVRGICRIEDEGTRELVIRQHNEIVRRLKKVIRGY